jgi:hypothetical protein
VVHVADGTQVQLTGSVTRSGCLVGRDTT